MLFFVTVLPEPLPALFVPELLGAVPFAAVVFLGVPFPAEVLADDPEVLAAPPAALLDADEAVFLVEEVAGFDAAEPEGP